MNEIEKQLHESSLSRVWQHMQEHDAGTITAFRYARDCGEGEKYTKFENLQRNKSLKAKLESKGYGVTVVKGSYIENYGSQNAIEVGEQVFLVVDIRDSGKLEKDLRTLGEEFEQDSILFVPKGGKGGELIGTNHCPNGYPGYNKRLKLNKTIFGEDGEFFTRVNGRPFTLKEEFEISTPLQGFFGKWAAKVLAEQHWSELDIDE